MYNDAGVTIYAWKQLSTEHVGRGVRVHLQRRRSARLHAHDARIADRPNAAAQLKRIGDFAMKKKIYAAYHTHRRAA